MGSSSGGDGLGARLEAGGRGWREVLGSGWAESPCCCCILGAGCGRLLGEVDWAELFLLIGVRLWPARGHLAGAGGLRRRNGGENSGPRSPQPPVPPLSSEEIELPGGSASAGGAAVITTTTRTRNANAIITDTIRHGGRYNKNLCFTGANCTHNLRKFGFNYP